MRWNNRFKDGLPLLLFLLPLRGSLGPGQGVNVLTRNYNNQGTGANLSETALNVSNVNPS
jgi:hypothetical protein